MSERPIALVAGGAGFIGSHLCQTLRASGRAVLCLDNLQTGHAANLGEFANDPHLLLVEHDVSLPLPDLGRVDEIWNLACAASPRAYQADPVHTLKSSVLGALHLLELARARRIPILQASTSEVYGDPEVHPQTEDYCGHVNPIGPRACYDEGKRAAETLFFDFHRRHGVAIKVARIFNTYGPRMAADDGRIVSNFVVQALQGRPLTVYGDGQQTRSFCYVDDLVRALVALMESPAAVTGPINLGNPEELAIAAVARRVLALTGSRSEIVYRPLPLDDPRRRRPDISKATTLLGWRPRIPFERGLARTVADFRARLKLPMAEAPRPRNFAELPPTVAVQG